jgi:hypothetical protein
MEDVGIFYVIWYIFHVLVCCTEKNLATLVAQLERKVKGETAKYKK